MKVTKKIIRLMMIIGMVMINICVKIHLRKY